MEAGKLKAMPAYIPRHLFSALHRSPRTVSDFIDAYLVGYGDWHGAEAEYPVRTDTNRTTEASNMAYALADLRKTFSVEPDSSPRAVADLPPADLRPGDLRAMQSQQIDAGLARSSINARKNRVLRWVRWLVEYEHADATLITWLGVVKAVKASRPGVRSTEEVVDVPADLVAATLKATRDYELRRAVRVQQLAGMRPGELLAMRVCYLHPEPSGSWTYRPSWTKTQVKLGFRREIPIGPQAQEQLRNQASTMGDQHGLWGSTVPRLGDAADERPVWRWNTVGGYYQAVCRAVKKAGVTHWHPNQLRHATLTLAFNEAGEETAASIGGHMDARTTRKHYFHGHAEKARLWAEEHG